MDIFKWVTQLAGAVGVGWPPVQLQVRVQTSTLIPNTNSNSARLIFYTFDEQKFPGSRGESNLIQLFSFQFDSAASEMGLSEKFRKEHCYPFDHMYVVSMNFSQEHYFTLPGEWTKISCQAYLIFVIFCTRARFFKPKFYTQKRVN